MPRLADLTRLHYTAPSHQVIARLRGAETSAPAAQRPSEQEGMLRAAFRDLHGAHLHGFALLVALGDRPLAAQLAAEALAEGGRRARELRHPDRASAWLRARVLHGVRGAHGRGPGQEERRSTLATLGVDRRTFDTLADFSPVERATLVAAVIERLDPLDLEVVLGTNAAVVHRQTAAIRRRFLEHRSAQGATESLAEPMLARRIGEIADRAMSWHRA
jgi:hypothetical protein